MGKVPTSVGIEADTLRQIDAKAQFNGYKSRSDLINDLLEKWVKNPVKKEAKVNE